MLGILLFSALICVCTGEDCGCGGFDFSAPSSPSGWDDAGNAASEGFYSGLDSSTGGSTSGGTSSGSSSFGEGSETSGSSGNGDSGLGSSNSGDISSDAAVLLTSKGIDLFRKGDFNNSLITLNASLDSDPYIPKTWMVKGDVLAAMGRYNEAILAYNRGIHLDPADPTAYAKTGDALFNEGKFSEAVASYDLALASNPGLTAVQANRTRAVDLSLNLIKGNLTTTQPTIAPEAPVLLPETAVNTSLAMAVPSPASTTKAPPSFIVLLIVIPIIGFMSIIFQRKI